jgi:hypothetical protein
MAESSDPFGELEELDIIESKELSVGSAFHAFRFRAALPMREDLDDETARIVDETLETLRQGTELDRDKLLDIIESEAVESNPAANFARGMQAAMKLMRSQ